jgi:hypothetical protein
VDEPPAPNSPSSPCPVQREATRRPRSGNAAFGFAEQFRFGESSDHFNVHGIEFDAIYGETADYEFTSELAEGAAPGRG